MTRWCGELRAAPLALRCGLNHRPRYRWLLLTATFADQRVAVVTGSTPLASGAGGVPRAVETDARLVVAQRRSRVAATQHAAAAVVLQRNTADWPSDAANNGGVLNTLCHLPAEIPSLALDSQTLMPEAMDDCCIPKHG